MEKTWFSPLPEFVAQHAHSEPEQRELAELLAKLGAVPDADPNTLERGRTRLLAAVSESSERFAPLFGKLMQFFDLTAEALRAVFTRAENASEWQPGPVPWVSLFHLDGGPKTAGLDTGLVRLKKGTPFPRHRHLGPERVLILQGGYHDHQEHWYGPGDFHDMPQGSEHALLMTEQEDVLIAVVMSGEIQVV